MLSIPAASQTGAVTCPRPTQLVRSRTWCPTPSGVTQECVLVHTEVRLQLPLSGRTRSPAPGWGCHVARSSPGAPMNLGQVERLGPDRLWEVCCYPQSREQGPEPQETENRRSEFRAVVHTGCPQEYSGDLKPYPRPINQNLWGGAQA